MIHEELQFSIKFFSFGNKKNILIFFSKQKQIVFLHSDRFSNKLQTFHFAQNFLLPLKTFISGENYIKKKQVFLTEGKEQH